MSDEVAPRDGVRGGVGRKVSADAVAHEADVGGAQGVEEGEDPVIPVILERYNTQYKSCRLTKIHFDPLPAEWFPIRVLQNLVWPLLGKYLGGQPNN